MAFDNMQGRVVKLPKRYLKRSRHQAPTTQILLAFYCMKICLKTETASKNCLFASTAKFENKGLVA
jgi:hypothetical protein